MAARSRDKAGNIGTSPSPLPPDPPYGRRLGGKGGVQIMSLAAGPPTAPVEATGDAEFLVVSAGRRYTWRVRRVGERDPRADGSGTRSRVVLQAPGGKSGMYLFEVRTANRAVQVPFAVQSVREERVLVVLPVTTWQGRNKVDDDGDGWPDTLEDGLPVRTARPYAGGVLPEGVADARRLRCSPPSTVPGCATTSRPTSRSPAGRARSSAATRGVVLAGDTRWMDGGVQRSLRAWVRDGGRCFDRDRAPAPLRRRDPPARDRADPADAARPLRRAARQAARAAAPG